MKSIKYIIAGVCASFLMVSCSLDNMVGPTAELNGSIIDAQTGALVEQDIIRGCVIELREHGYDPVSVQELIIKNDGTYKNSRLFEAMYQVNTIRSNFIPVDTMNIMIKGVTTQDFSVTPYIRINDAHRT